ncbi:MULTISPECIES: pirin family protein [Kocuria]|uniref:pirin family protein n=1 Tax=Kocuria sp. BT304 TaxID=1702043 RepID=UPI000DD33F65|nr:MULTISPECIES: pirin family protein [Kocuria]
MSNPEKNPQPTVCRPGAAPVRGGLRSGVVVVDGQDGPVEILEPRDVPLGGPRGMTVRRTLPQKGRSLIGAWCFLDSYGPDDVAATGGMKVARHPHTGLATVSWLFEGRIDHVDSAGNWATVRPGEVDLMNAGRGITHSEFSTANTSVLHGVQLWYAFPDADRFGEPSLDTHRPEPVTGEGFSARVFIGSLLGTTSPIATRLPLTGAELRIEPRTTVEIDVPPEHEHGALRVDGPLSLDGVQIPRHGIGFTGTGRSRLRLTTGEDAATVLLIGGAPLHEQIVMWWNFVGRSHEEIETWRRAYMEEMGFVAPGPDSPLAPDRAGQPVGGSELDELLGTAYDDGRPFPQFGTFPPGQADPLPAPELPNAVLRPRG